MLLERCHQQQKDNTQAHSAQMERVPSDLKLLSSRLAANLRLSAAAAGPPLPLSQGPLAPNHPVQSAY